MAQDLSEIVSSLDSVAVECIEDEGLHQAILEGKVGVALIGSDCVLQDQIVNKVGTKALAETCQASSNCSIMCCGDRWKQWDDVFPPPLEDIFECVPKHLFDQVIVPD